jgi:hypothetical protein
MSTPELENIRHVSTAGIILGCLYVAAGITGLCMLWLARSDARAESRELRARRAYGRYLKRR